MGDEQTTPSDRILPRADDLLAALPVAVLVVDREGERLFANAAATEVLGADVDVLLVGNAGAGNAFVAGTDDPYPEDRMPLARALRGEGTTAEDVEIRRGGVARRFEVRAAPVPNERGEVSMAVAVLSEITARKDAEAQLALTHELALAIARSRTVEEAMEVVLATVCRRAGWAFGQAWLPETDAAHLACAPGWYAGSEELRAFREASEALRIPLDGAGPLATVWRTREPAWITDVRQERLYRRAPFARELGLVTAVIVPVLASGEPVAVLEFLVFEARQRDWRSLAMISAAGTQLGALIRAKQAGELMQRSHEELERALEIERDTAAKQRVVDNAKNSFLQAISHELRSPLAAITGSAAMLDSELDHPQLREEDRRQLLLNIVATAEEMNRLVTDLLYLDRLVLGVVEPRRTATDVAALVERMIERLEELRERPVELDVERVVAELDELKVERIVDNLLSNALKYSPPGSPILVTARRTDAAVLLGVDDAGPGVPPEMRQAVFEPFSRSPDAAARASGLGIGLSLVARFAELHGGRAWVEESTGGGAAFRVLLPGRIRADGRGDAEATG